MNNDPLPRSTGSILSSVIRSYSNELAGLEFRRQHYQAEIGQADARAAKLRALLADLRASLLQIDPAAASEFLALAAGDTE